MKTSGFLGDYTDTGLAMVRPGDVTDDPNPATDTKPVHITDAGNNVETTEKSGVQKRNMWLLAGAGLLSITLIFWIFNRNE